MPNMSGWELLKTMKNNIHFFLIPVIILSASSDKENVEKCLLDGASEYL